MNDVKEAMNDVKETHWWKAITWCKENNWKTSDVAVIIERSVSMASLILNGRRRPTHDVAFKLEVLTGGAVKAMDLMYSPAQQNAIREYIGTVIDAKEAWERTKSTAKGPY